MASHTKTQPNSGFNRRLFLAGAAGGAMIPAVAHAAPTPKKRGVWKHKASISDPDVKLADFSYQNDELAALIVQAWTTPNFRDSLVGKNTSIADRTANAKAALQGLSHPIKLTSPIVITEDEYDQGWDSDSDDQVVFVLPNSSRQVGNLLENAKLLMAVTPNGI